MFFWSHLYGKNQNCATYLNEKPKNVICKKIATPKSHRNKTFNYSKVICFKNIYLL